MDWDQRLELTTNTVSQHVPEDVKTFTQESKIHRKYHGKTGYLLGNIDAGIQEFAGMGYRVNDVQMMRTDKWQMMTTHGSCTSQSHKRIAQNDHQNKMTSHPGMEMMNNAFGCSRATQVCMEDLRLANLTEIHPSRRGECFKAPC